jgi:hypothetical protein
MIMKQTVARVRYPDEIDEWYFDALDYEDVVEGLKKSLKTAKGQLKIDMQETLAELENRWEARQAKTKRTDVLTRKVSSSV